MTTTQQVTSMVFALILGAAMAAAPAAAQHVHDDQDYQVPFRFTGTLDRLTLNIDRPEPSEADKQRLMAAQRNNKMSE